MGKQLKAILEALPAYRETLNGMREFVLANAVMFNEIPAPTFNEENRVRFLRDRFNESYLKNISIDEAGNGSAILPGKKGRKNILLSAHADTVFPSNIDHTMKVETEHLMGPGIADNSLGLAVVATLPMLLEKLGLKFDGNLILLGATQSLGQGNLHGLRFFLDNIKMPIRAGVCVEGVHLGRLSFSSLGMLRGIITCRVPMETDWERFGSSGSIIILNKIISEILAIPTSTEPKTSIILGSVRAGTAFNTVPMNGLLRLEVRSEGEGVIGQIKGRIDEILRAISSQNESEIKLSVIARLKPGGVSLLHPIVKCTREIMEVLNINHRIAPSVGDLAALIDKNIPGVTLGITRGDNLHEENESVAIEPILNGIVQLIAVLLAIDKGLCDDN